MLNFIFVSFKPEVKVMKKITRRKDDRVILGTSFFVFPETEFKFFFFFSSLRVFLLLSPSYPERKIWMSQKSKEKQYQKSDDLSSLATMKSNLLFFLNEIFVDRNWFSVSHTRSVISIVLRRFNNVSNIEKYKLFLISL